MSLLELWRVLVCDTLVKVARNYDNEVLYAGSAGDMPARLFPMRVCYVDILDCQDILFISAEEMAVPAYIVTEELEGCDND